MLRKKHFFLNLKNSYNKKSNPTTKPHNFPQGYIIKPRKGAEQTQWGVFSILPHNPTPRSNLQS
jgi:hypothetical protein